MSIYVRRQDVMQPAPSLDCAGATGRPQRSRASIKGVRLVTKACPYGLALFASTQPKPPWCPLSRSASAPTDRHSPTVVPLAEAAGCGHVLGRLEHPTGDVIVGHARAIPACRVRGGCTGQQAVAIGGAADTVEVLGVRYGDRRCGPVDKRHAVPALVLAHQQAITEARARLPDVGRAHVKYRCRRGSRLVSARSWGSKRHCSRRTSQGCVRGTSWHRL